MNTTVIRPKRSDQYKIAPTTMDIETAAKLLGIGRQTAYQLARAGVFPGLIAPASRLGRSRYRVAVRRIAIELGITDQEVWDAAAHFAGPDIA